MGRYLQVLGADILPDAKGNNGTDIDFRATFPDGVVVSVECVSKKYNQEAQTEIDRNADMANMLDEVGPHLWAISFRTLPKAMTTAEFQPYVDRATEFYATLPTAVDGGDHIPYEWMGEHGLMRLKALPFPRGTRANHMGAGVSWVDDSILRLKDALIDSHKRKQARGAYPPVFLAIDCPFNGPDAEDFDGALFGTSVDHRGFDLHEISVPTMIWQGTDDLFVPFSHGQWLAARVPGASTHLEQGEGHLSLALGAVDRMFDEFTSAGSPH